MIYKIACSAIIALLFCGCGGGGFAKFYEPNVTDDEVEELKSGGLFVDELAPEVFFNDYGRYMAYHEMLVLEYECLVIGQSSFNGALTDIWWGTTSEGDAERHAKSVGANYYIRYAGYTGTKSGTYTYMMPSTSTSNTNMNARAYGSGGWASGYGTATTTTTSMIPMVGSYSIDEYNQIGIFYLCP